MNVAKLLIVCSITMLTACGGLEQENGLPQIDLGQAMENPSKITASQFGAKIRYIPLETTNESLIASDAYVRVINNKLIVASHLQPLQMFDKETGRFIRTIGSLGQGPNEYMSHSSPPVFWVDEAAEIIYVKTAGARLARFDAEGNPIGDLTIPEDFGKAPIGEMQCVAHNNQMYCYRRFFLSGAPLTLFGYDIASSEVTEIDRKEQIGTITHDAINKIEVVKGQHFGVPVSPGGIIIGTKDDRLIINILELPALWEHNGTVRFKESFNDTIYDLTENRLVPSYVFDLGKWHCPSEEQFQCENGKNRIDIHYLMEGQKAVYFTFRSDICKWDTARVYHGVYNKMTRQTTVSKQTRIENDLTELPPVTLQTTASKGAFVGLCTASDVVEWLEENPSSVKSEEYNTLARLKDDDNPVVVLIE